MLTLLIMALSMILPVLFIVPFSVHMLHGGVPASSRYMLASICQATERALHGVALLASECHLIAPQCTEPPVQRSLARRMCDGCMSKEAGADGSVCHGLDPLPGLVIDTFCVSPAQAMLGVHV